MRELYEEINFSFIFSSELRKRRSYALSGDGKIMKQLTKAIIETFVAFLIFVVGLGILFANSNGALFASYWWSILVLQSSAPFIVPIMLILSFVVFFMLAYVAIRIAHRNDVLQAQLEQFSLQTKIQKLELELENVKSKK